MDTGELLALLLVLFVLLVGGLIISVRCCRSACTLLRESAANDAKFSASIRDGLRRSIRRLSFHRRGASFRQGEQARGRPEPVARVATIEDLHRERSDLHPKYRGTLIPREEGDGASGDSAGDARGDAKGDAGGDAGKDAKVTTSVPDCTVHFTSQKTEKVEAPKLQSEQQNSTATDTKACVQIAMLDEVRLQVCQERLLRSDPLPSIDVSNESSTDTTPMTSRNRGTRPISSHMVELNLLETGDGFSNPGYESGSMLDLVTHDDDDGDGDGDVGGFENPGYLVIGTPEPPRSRKKADPEPSKNKDHPVVENKHSKSLAEDFKDIQIQSKCLIDLQGETDVDAEIAEQGTQSVNNDDKLSSTGLILGVPKPFTRGGVNRASIGALKSRPGKLTEDIIKRINADDRPDPDQETDISAADRYYQPPSKNPMYPERTDVTEEPEPEMTYVHACYELTGTGVIFSDEDVNALTTDSFI